MIYTYSEAELHALLARLAKEGKRYKEPIQRYKGLGEMDAEQLAETTMDPRHRMLRKVNIENAQQAEATFDLLMGSDVAPRKDFIIAGAPAWTASASTPKVRRVKQRHQRQVQPSRPGTISRAVGIASSSAHSGQDGCAEAAGKRRLG